MTYEGLLGSGVTATIDYTFDDATDIFSFTLTNTSPVGGYITNIGLDIGNLLELTSLSENSALVYSFSNGTSSPPPPFGPAIGHPTDFTIFTPNQIVGLNVGESVTMEWGLAVIGGGPVTGITGKMIAKGISLRFWGLPVNQVTPDGTDIAVAPEPASLSLIALAAAGLAMRRACQSRMS